MDEIQLEALMALGIYILPILFILCIGALIEDLVNRVKSKNKSIKGGDCLRGKR